MLSILLIEDNYELASQVIQYIEMKGWEVDYADTGNLGKKLATSSNFDVIILDLNLPDMDGLEVAQYIKSFAEVIPPILMLTARDSFENKMLGFKSGADDYITKPFDLRELILRCQALYNRKQLYKTNRIKVGDLHLDKHHKQVFVGGVEIELTTSGMSILTTLMEAYPNSVTRNQLMKVLWGTNFPDSDALKSHIYKLRNALQKVESKQVIKTVNNIGYRLINIE